MNNVKLSLYVLDGRSVSAFESKGYDLYSVVVIRLYAAFGEEKSVQVLRLNAVVKFYAVVISVQMGNYEIKELIPEQKNSAHKPHN